MKKAILTATLVLSVHGSLASAAQPRVPLACSQVKVTQRFANEMRNFLLKTFPETPKLEVELPRLGIQYLMTPTQVVAAEQLSSRIPGENVCVVVARACAAEEESSKKNWPRTDCETHYDYNVQVLAYHPKTKKFSKFEDALMVPNKIVASFYNREIPLSKYYAEISGASVIDFYKANLAGIEQDGLTGLVVLSGKSAFDPTPNRIWKLVDANYSLTRGTTGEAVDICSYHFDESPEVYLSGAIQQTSREGEIGALIAPWGCGTNGEVIRVLE